MQLETIKTAQTYDRLGAAGGGTNFGPPLREATNLVKKNGHQK